MRRARAPIRTTLTRAAHRSVRLIVATSTAFLLVGVSPSLAAPGDLDASFGDAGIATNGGGFAHGIAIQSSGNIVAGGSDSGPRDRFVLTRYEPDGSVDRTFGDQGVVETPLSVSGSPLVVYGNALVRQPDDKLLMIGQAYTRTDPPRFFFAVARYSADGTLDRDFGTNGILLDDLGGRDNHALGGTVDGEGRIIVVGGVARPDGQQGAFAVVRYRRDGTRDASFGDGGLVTTPFGGKGSGAAYAYAAAIDPDGKLVVSGRNQDCPQGQSQCNPLVFSVARYDESGGLDTGFGASGKVEARIGLNTDEPWGLAIQPDGKVVVGGRVFERTEAGEPQYSFGIARFDCSGALDQGFGSGGTTKTAFEDPGLVTTGVGGLTLQPDGKLIAVGYIHQQKWGITRYTPEGILDSSFGTGGTKVFERGGGFAYGAMLDGSNRLVLGGGVGMAVGRVSTGLDAASRQRPGTGCSSPPADPPPEPPPDEPPARSYVALGDSVSAGEGIGYGWYWSATEKKWVGGNDTGIWDHRFYDTDACHQRAESHPRVVEGRLAADLLQLSCTGASTMNGILKDQYEDPDTGKKLMAPAQLGGPGYDEPNTRYDAAKPNVVTLSLGADDVKFDHFVEDCVFGGCDLADNRRLADRLLAEQKQNLEKVLAEIGRRGALAGNLPLAVLTKYYDPFPTEWTETCVDLDVPGPGLQISRPEMNFLREGLERLNKNIADVAARSSFAWALSVQDGVDGQEGFDEHPFCADKGPWVFGASIGVPSWAGGGDFESSAPFHPTKEGQEHIGKAVARFVESQRPVTAGSSVRVLFPSGVALSFDAVRTPGSAAALREADIAGRLPPASSFAKHSAYEIVSSAQHSGPIRVSLPAPRALSLFHYVGGRWTKVPSRYADGRVTGEVSSLSPFALGEEVSPVHARFSHGPPGVAPSTVAFDASGSSVEDSSRVAAYEWDFGDGTSDTGVAPSHTFKQSGTYTVTLRATGANGAVDETRQDLIVTNTPPRAVLDAPTSGRSGVELSFSAARSTDPNGRITEAAWDFGDGTSPTGGREVRHTFARPGTYTVTLQVSDDEGVPDAAVHTVTISAPASRQPPTPPTIVPPPTQYPSFAASAVRLIGRISVSRSGIARIRLACLRQDGPCTGRLELRDGGARARPRLLGRAPVRVGDGRTGVVAVKLTRTARAKLRRRALPARLAVHLAGIGQRALDVRVTLPRAKGRSR